MRKQKGFAIELMIVVAINSYHRRHRHPELLRAAWQPTILPRPLPSARCEREVTFSKPILATAMLTWPRSRRASPCISVSRSLLIDNNLASNGTLWFWKERLHFAVRDRCCRGGAPLRSTPRTPLSNTTGAKASAHTRMVCFARRQLDHTWSPATQLAAPEPDRQLSLLAAR